MIRNNWDKAKLNDKAYEVRDLYSPNANENIPYIGLEHIEQNSLRLAGIGQSSATVSSKKSFIKNDILFGSLRPYFRKVVKPKFNGVCSTDITVVRAKPKTDQTFLYYFISDRAFIDYATNISNGTKMPRANWKVLSLSEWFFPPLPTQRKIAAVLSAYDDLIENNMRRIKILEEIAQNIYSEWFVKFRFPGHEKSKMVDSSVGKIPEGWMVGQLNTIATIRSGYAFSSKDYMNEGRYGLVTIRNVQDGLFIEDCSDRLDNVPTNLPDYCYLDDGDLLLSLTGNVGRVCLAFGQALLLNQRVAKLVPLDSENKAFIYAMFRNGQMREQLERISNGVAQQNLSPIKTGEIKIIIPSPGLLKEYSQLAMPMIKEILVLFKKDAFIRSTRDLLLPKLISGELDLSDLDIITGDDE